jgi:hypothetical protein
MAGPGAGVTVLLCTDGTVESSASATTGETSKSSIAINGGGSSEAEVAVGDSNLPTSTVDKSLKDADSTSVPSEGRFQHQRHKILPEELPSVASLAFSVLRRRAAV